MKQYKHLLIVMPEHAPEKVWRHIAEGIESLQSNGYRMIDYHDTQAFTVLVFERDGDGQLSDIGPMPKILDYGPAIGFGAR